METRLLIIDGNSLGCRAVLAHNPKFGPDLQTVDGKPTGGTYRFFTMLDKILKQIRPTHMVVAWDMGRNTWRSEKYPEYKANRENKDKSLFIQFEDIKNILTKVGIQNMGVIGFEGDDIVGSYKKMSKATKNYIVSGDRDCFQLVDDNTFIIYPKNGFSEIELITKEYILNKYDVPVEQFIDFKALMGDSGDNIPGIEGCGEKTAVKLLKHFGSAKKVAETNGEFELKGVNKKVKAGIKFWAPDSDLMLELVTIRQDIPQQFLFDFDSLALDLDWDNAYDLFKELQFTSFIKKLRIGDFYGCK